MPKEIRITWKLHGFVMTIHRSQPPKQMTIDYDVCDVDLWISKFTSVVTIFATSKQRFSYPHSHPCQSSTAAERNVYCAFSSSHICFLPSPSSGLTAGKFLHATNSHTIIFQLLICLEMVIMRNWLWRIKIFFSSSSLVLLANTSKACSSWLVVYFSVDDRMVCMTDV